ncbi:MAG: NADPH-dependent F420 reductase [Candidatus Polarisedimenticolia bacterium]
MTIGIIGAGGIGQAFASQVAKVGYEVSLSNSRGPDSLADIVNTLGPRAKAVTRHQAAQADVVLLAVPWPRVREALSELPPWNGRILIDATNPVVQPGFRLADLEGSTSSQIVASLAPGARVVKAANTLLRAMLAADPKEAGGRRVLFMSGDDAAAKAVVGGILEKAGFATIDLGGLATGGSLQQFPGGPLPTLNLIKLG